MINRSLLATALVLAGSTFMAEGAFANSVDVNFSGTVQGICSFGNVTNGILAAEGMGSPQGAYFLGSTVPGGSAGQVTVSCNQPANLQVTGPTQTAGPGGNNVGASVSSSYGSVTVGNPVPMLPLGGFNPLFLNPGSTPLSVDLVVAPGNGQNYVAPGNYGYKVTLTVVP
ncbi:MAG TPA: hypothetical protein VK184_23105 [Nostocaceae cyanobacterium]|nr:hypothetical protein [Nostocaceae cyanobacterium]